MTDQELCKLKRSELLQIMLEQSKEIERLMWDRENGACPQLKGRCQ